jgi:spore coat polysaccharide biosynthesis protein SpsF
MRYCIGMRKTKPAPHTPQARFWRGRFGDIYTARNEAMGSARARVPLWAQILDRLAGAPPRSILEVGANIGNNLRALRALSEAELYAVEPNARARRRLVADRVLPAAHVRDGVASAIDFPDGVADLAFTSGVLIHIHPRDLLASCREIHRVARRYVACVEYYAMKPEALEYRGHAERLFKRDFGGYWLDHFRDLRLLGYGFCWDRVTRLDNVTWWLFEKRVK